MRPRTRWLWLLIANPLTAATLLAALWTDLRHLAFDDRGASTCGEFYRRKVSPRPPRPFIAEQPPPPDTWIARDHGTLRIGGSEGGKAAPSKHAEPFPKDAVYEGGLRLFVTKGQSGFWAITRNETRHCIVIMSRGHLSDAQAAQVRQQYVDRFLAPDWTEDPAILPRLRAADATTWTPRWSGYRHNALAAAALVLVLTALAGTPSSFRHLIHLRRSHRLRRDICPSCGYSLANLASPTCPECGRPATHP